MKFRFLLLTLSFLMLTVSAFAQVGAIEGIVLLPGENGAPAAGAAVTIYTPQRDSMVTVADEAGAFSFAEVPVGFYPVVARLDGYLAGETHARVMPNQTANVTVHLRNLPTGLGNVVGLVLLPMHGGPAAAATVTLSREGAEDLVAITDEAGHFGFEALAVGRWNLVAALEGYLPAEGHVMIPESRTAEITIVLRAALTDVGNVVGDVTFADGTVAARAMVDLNGGPHRFYRAITDEAGHFAIDNVLAGPYTITVGCRMHGHAIQRIEVVAEQTTTVALVLEDSTHGPGGGGHHGDTLTIVEVTGTVIVVAPDSLFPARVRYFLDIDADAVADYVLAFGPPWYQPQSGAVRPVNGDEITVSGGLLTYTEPPVVVVYELNGLLWREPFRGHGGHGGGDHHNNGCGADSLIAVELEGIAQVFTGEGPHGERTLYAIDTNADGERDAMLDFGRPDYLPPSEAVRPLDGETVSIVGGQIYCPDRPLPMVIVYEINGLIWREPGDTLGLGAVTQLAVEEPVAIGAPLSYLTVENYPNPFNPVTTLAYNVPVSGEVKLAIFDINGRKVMDLVNGFQEAGSYAVPFNGTEFASGTYFYRLSAGHQMMSGRMMLLK